MKIIKYVTVCLALFGASHIAFGGDFILVPNVGTTPGPAISVPGSVGGTALFQAIDQGPTGTGNFQPFLRVQRPRAAS